MREVMMKGTAAEKRTSGAVSFIIYLFLLPEW